MYSPHQLTILTTNKCTATCGHCSVSSSPTRTGKLSFEQMRVAIDGVMQQGPLNTVIWAGGEPTLLGQQLLEAIAYAHSLGLNTRIVTNASWAVSEKKAKAKIVALREAGLNELNVSADDYHLPDVPFQNVKYAWQAAHGEGFLTALIAISYGPKSMVTPVWVANQLEEYDLTELEPSTGLGNTRMAKYENGTSFVVYGTYLQKLGRSHSEVPDHDFQKLPWEALTGGCPYAANSPAISPKNHLLACCGFELSGNQALDFGSLQSKSVSDLYRDVERNLVVKAISDKGPAFVADFVRRKDPTIDWRPSYSSVCEVCEHVTTRRQVLKVLEDNRDEFAAEVVLGGVAAKAQMEV